MVTNILRRGGAWRFAALDLLAASLSFGALGASQDTAEAHEGAGLCGTGWWPTATYMWQFTNPDGPHYHTWLLIDQTLYDHFCGYNP